MGRYFKTFIFATFTSLSGNEIGKIVATNLRRNSNFRVMISIYIRRFHEKKRFEWMSWIIFKYYWIGFFLFINKERANFKICDKQKILWNDWPKNTCTFLTINLQWKGIFETTKNDKKWVATTKTSQNLKAIF